MGSRSWSFPWRTLLCLIAIHFYFRRRKQRESPRMLDPSPFLLRIKRQNEYALTKKKPLSQDDKRGFILVTGGAGFLGSHICKVLSSAGYKVRAIDLTLPSPARRAEGAQYIALNLVNCEDKELNQVMDGCTGIIHAAGLVALFDAYALLFNIHVFGTAKLLAVAAEHPDVRVFVQTSTTGVVHNGERNFRDVPHNVPYHANHLSGYGKTKHKAEIITRLANHPSGVLTTSLRLPGVFGYGDGMAVTKMIDEGITVVPGKQDVRVEMLYVKNAAQAHVCALQTLFAEARDMALQNRELHANGNAFFITNSIEKPEQLSIIDLWRNGLKILGIPKPLMVLPCSVSWTMAYVIEFIYWYFQGFVPATRNSIWNLTPKSLNYMLHDNTFGGQREAKEALRYIPLFSTEAAFHDLKLECEANLNKN